MKLEDLVFTLHENVKARYTQIHPEKRIIEYGFYPLPGISNPNPRKQRQLNIGFAYGILSVASDENYVVKVGSQILLERRNTFLEREVAPLEAVPDKRNLMIRLYYKTEDKRRFNRIHEFFRRLSNVPNDSATFFSYD